MAYTDFVTFFLSILFLFRGASRGFVRSLIVPVSILLATLISIIYYQITKEIIISLIIGLFGPMLLHIFFSILLKLWAKSTNTEIKPDFLSRLGGAILTLAWGWVFLAFALILLAVFPPWGKILTTVHNDVTNSASYMMVRPWGENFFGTSKQNITAVTNVVSGSEANSLAQDPRFKAVLNDPDVKNEIEAHDFVKLMSNPKMIALTQQIMSDPATMKKVMAIYSSQTKTPNAKNPDST